MAKQTIKIPKYAKVISGHWKNEDKYGDVWCLIREINIENNELSLEHPQLGSFAWVNIKSCEFAYSIPKKDKSLFKSNGYYLYLNGREILFNKELDVIYQYIEDKLGEWLRSNAEKWSEYAILEYLNGKEIDSFSY